MSTKANNEDYNHEDYYAVEGVVPRVSVEAFCISPGFATSLRDSNQDRRMFKATMNVYEGGVEAAVSTYEDAHTPDLLIVETATRGFEVFAELEHLASVCDPETKVIVAGPSNDVTLYRELMRQGIDEYLVVPAAPMQIIDAIHSTFADPESVPLARTIGFIGSKGGVGSSTLAHNVAWNIAERNLRNVALLDLDLEFGTVDLNFNQDPSRTIADAVGDGEDLDDTKLSRLFMDYTEHLKLLAAPASLMAELDLDDQAAMRLIETARQVSDILVLDIPHNWTAWSQQAIMQMDEIVIVAMPDLASLRNTKNLYDAIRGRRRNDGPPKVVINQVGMPKRPEIPIKEFAGVLEVQPSCVIPYDAVLFGKAANNGVMIGEMDASSASSKLIADLAGSLAAKTLSGASRKKDSGGISSLMKGLKSLSRKKKAVEVG